MMQPIFFDLPAEENPEPGLPERITHGCDYMLQADGTTDYYYNYLVYSWKIDDAEISARSYFDHLHEISVFVPAGRLKDDPALHSLVRFLQRRYSDIRSFHKDDVDIEGTGYVLVYRRQH
jgi:hypothetical protein